MSGVGTVPRNPPVPATTPPPLSLSLSLSLVSLYDPNRDHTHTHTRARARTAPNLARARPYDSHHVSSRHGGVVLCAARCMGRMRGWGAVRSVPVLLAVHAHVMDVHPIKRRQLVVHVALAGRTLRSAPACVGTTAALADGRVEALCAHRGRVPANRAWHMHGTATDHGRQPSNRQMSKLSVGVVQCTLRVHMLPGGGGRQAKHAATFCASACPPAAQPRSIKGRRVGRTDPLTRDPCALGSSATCLCISSRSGRAPCRSRPSIASRDKPALWSRTSSRWRSPTFRRC